MKRKLLLRLLVLLLFFSMAPPIASASVTAFAGSWTEGEEGSFIYGGKTSGETKAYKEDKPGFLSKFIAELLYQLGISFENLFNQAGISIDGIVYGRVNGNGTGNVAIFTFELKKGNPYDLVASAIYQIFRTVCYGIIAVIVYGKLSINSYRRMTPQILGDTKASAMHLALSFLLLALMPYLLDVVLYLRDVFLYLISSQAADYLFDVSECFSLTGLFRGSAKDGLTSAIVYVASVFYSLYLAFLYAGYALSFLLCFAAFPLVVIASNLKKSLLQNWVSTVSYFIFIPVLDAALLLVPAYMSARHISPIIALLTCMGITSARGIFAQLLGLQDKGGGMMGMAAMLAAGRMVGSAVSTGAAAAGMLKGAKSDESMVRYEEEMARGSGGSAGPMPLPDGGSPLSAESAGIDGSAGMKHVPWAGASAGTAPLSEEAVPSSSRGAAALRPNAADKYATIDNFESGPFGSQISHSKRAELYRQRAAQRRKQAFGTMAGGSLGALAGASTGMMMGPAATAMGAGMGMAYGAMAGGAALYHARPAAGSRQKPVRTRKRLCPCSLSVRHGSPDG